jgi:hypothetical protein
MPIDDRNIDPQIIADYIISRNILDKKSINDALNAFLEKKIEAGFAYYSLENYGQIIELKDEKGTVQKSIELAIKPDKKTKWIPYSSNSVLVLDENEPDFKKIIDRGKQKGLALGNSGGYLKIKDNCYLLNQWFFELVSTASTSSLPVDLYIPGKQTNYIFLTDRGSGKLYILPANLKEIIKEIQVRQVDTKKAINLAYSAKAKKCFITDNQTPDLVVLNLDTKNTERFYHDYGPLGNLIISKDESLLYIVGCEADKPASLLVVSANGYKLVKKIPLKGKFFSEADDPSDLITISPDGKYIYVMTFTDTPALFTPVVSVVSTEKNEVIREIQLDTDEKPVGISFKVDLPLPEQQPSFSQLLVDKRLILDSNMDYILKELQSYQEVKREYTETKLLDQDVSDLQAQLEQQLNVSEDDLKNLLEPESAQVESFLKESGIDWQGRRMSQEDKESLIKKMADLNTNPEVSKTNGVFVLSWMDDLLGP